MSQQRVFVTGATGLVGYHVARHLAQLGYQVVAGVRRTSKTEALAQLPAVTIAVCDLSDENSLESAMSGCSAVIHCAGAVDPHARREEIMATNVGGTRNAIAAAIKCGAPHFIHISSLSVITGQDDQYDVDESAPLRYCGEAYADSKVDAEKVVSAASGIATTILRPGFIYGPGEHAWMPRLISNLRNGKAMLIDGGGRQTNVIYVENLALAVELTLFNEKAYGQVYNLTDGLTPTKKELFDAICDGLEIKRVTRTIPRPVAKLVCETVSTIAPMLSPDARQTLSRFSRAAFRLAAINQGFSIAKAERELGYLNRIPFSQGMAETLRSFKASVPPQPQPAGQR
jgi:nucleoside-diphosphate-sugar epimerase